MRKKTIFLTVLLIFVFIFRLSAQDASGVQQADDVKKLLSVIAVKQYEIIEKYPVSGDENERRIDELRKLYLRYFQTEESLRFDKNTFGGGKLSDLVNYVGSDDGVISVFSWVEYRYRYDEWDSIVQYRDSAGRLRTASLTQMASESDEFVGSSFNKIYKLKEGVYLLQGEMWSIRYVMADLITIELKNYTVIPYLAFNNTMRVVFGLPLGDFSLEYLPLIFNMQIISKHNLFAIELDILFPRDPKNMYEINYLIDDDSAYFFDPITPNKLVIPENTTEVFIRKEKFVFNGTEFLGNYWVFHKYWTHGERPADILHYFPETEFTENARQKEIDERENTKQQEFDEAGDTADNKTALNLLKNKKKYFLLFLSLLSLITIFYSIIKLSGSQ